MKRLVGLVGLFCATVVLGATVPPFISHRGESIDAPENSVAAFRLAAARGVAGIECDVYTSSDGVPICLHDATFARTGGVDKTPGELTWAEISQISAANFGSWATSEYKDEKVPSLAQYLEVIAANDVIAFIELKNGTGLVDAVVDVVRKAPGLDLAKVQFIAFGADHVRAVRAALPQCKASLLLSSFTTADDLIAKLAACDATGVDLEYTAAFTAADVAAVKAAGYAFHVWTINDVNAAAAAALKGVDSITTDKGLYLRNNIEPAMAALEAANAKAAELLNPIGGGTIVIAPGNGVGTNVTEAITGPVNVQINNTPSGGGLVTLSALSDYMGHTYVKSGTLAVGNVGSVLEPSAIGAAADAANAVVIGNGTFHFTGDSGVTDRDFLFLPDAALKNAPGVIKVDAGCELRVTGRVTGFDGGQASFAKIGDGTFTLATRTPGTVNEFYQNRSSHGSSLQINANGDSITTGVSCYNVLAGRVVVDVAAGVTNRFGNEVLVGAIDPTPNGAHLDIKGGYNDFIDWLAIARSSGNSSTDPAQGFCSVNVSGGTTRINNLGFAYQNGNRTTYNSLAVVNVSGGTMETRGRLRVDHTKSRGVVNVSGGTFKVTESIIAFYNAGSQFTVNLTGGAFDSTGTFDASKNGDTVVRFNLTGGTFACGTLKHTASTDTQILASDVAMTIKGNWTLPKMICGPRPASLAVSGSRTLKTALVADGTDAALDISAAKPDDVLTIDGTVGVPLRVATQTKLALGGNTVTAPVSLDDAATLRLTAATTLPDLRMAAEGRLAFAGASAKLTLAAWRTPQVLKVTLADAATLGATDLVTFPASVDLSTSQIQVENPVAGKSYAFEVREDGATRTLAVTVSAASSTVADPVGYTTRFYPFSSFTSSTVAGPITVTGTKNHMMGVDVPEGETLTFAGGLTQEQGGFMKLGAGTLRLAGPHDYVFAKDFGVWNGLFATGLDPTPFDASGVSLHARAALEVCGGTLHIGDMGQTFRVNVQECWVGSVSQTTGVQPDAAIIQEGGHAHVVATCLCIGRNPGYWLSETENTLGDKEYMSATYTLRGGSFDVHSFIMGYDNAEGAPQRAKFEMFGGSFRQIGSANGDKFRIGATGRHSGVNEAAFVMHGGTAEIAAAVTYPYSSAKALISLSDGAELTFLNGITFRNGPSAVFAITNSTVRFTTAFSGTSNNTLILDGATLIPGANTGDVNLQKFGTFVYGTGGLTIDTSRMTAGWFNVSHPLRGTGVLTVRGDDTDRSVCLRDQEGGHDCPVVIEQGGAVSLAGVYASNCTVRVRAGGALWNTGGGGYANPLASLTLGDDENSVTYLRGTEYGADNLWGFRPRALTVNGMVHVAFRQTGTALLARTISGRAQVLTAPRGSIDLAQFAVDPRVAATGVTGTFSIEQNADGTDTLWLEAASATDHVHTWNVGDGAWGDAANWANNAAPDNLPGDPITFPATLAAAARVDLGGATPTLGNIASQARADVTLANGTLRLDNAASLPELASTGGGTLTVPALTCGETVVKKDVQVKGRVALTGPLGNFQKVVAADDAILSGNPVCWGAVPIEMKNAWLRPTASGVYQGLVTATGNGLFVDVPEGVVAGFANINNQKPFVKIGRGTLVLTGTGNFYLGRYALGDINAKEFMFPTNGTTPVNGSPAVGIYGGRVIMGREGQTIKAENNEFWIGGHPVMEADGTTADVQLDFCGGTLTVGSFLGVGRTKQDIPTNNEYLRRRPNYTFNLHAGEVAVDQFLMNYCTEESKMCVKSTVNIYDGVFKVRTGRFAIGHHASTVKIDGKGNEAVFNVYGGSVYSQKENVWVSGYSSQGGTGELNLFGGVFDASFEVASRPKTADVDWGVIRLAGGTLKAQRLYKHSGNGKATLILNGGAFQPTTDAALSGFDVCYASTNATAIDVSLVESHTLDQAVGHDAELGDTPDGGLVKRGHGRLLVKQALTFTGPLTVHEGAVDLNGADLFALNALAGSGDVTNGSLLVAGTVEPKGDADAETFDYGVTLTVEALKFGAGATWKVGVVDAETGLANRLAVAGTMSAAGVVTVDFGHTAEDPLPSDFVARIGSVGAGTSLPSFACVNTGLSAGRRMLVTRVGETDLYARAVPTGSVLLFR